MESPTGEVVREFSTLINPERDIGPTHGHAISASDVLEAPTFEEAAGHILDAMRGCAAIAGHNVRFDRSFLMHEFSRVGVDLPECTSLCTMSLAWGGTLSECCSDFGVTHNKDVHSALADARATARLLREILKDEPDLVRDIYGLPPISWPAFPLSDKQPSPGKHLGHDRHSLRLICRDFRN